MYESVYLYEQLKRQTIEESYLESLNVLTEACADVKEAKCKVKETLDEIEETAKGKKWSLMERLKRKTNKVKKALKFNRESALETRPIGLNFNSYKVIKSEADIRKVHENAINFLNEFDPNTASDVEVKLFIENVRDNSIYRDLVKVLNEGKYTCAVSNVVTDVIDKEINKDDISGAIEFLEKDPGEHKDYQACLCATELEPLTNKDKLRETAYNYKKALVAIVDEAYYDMLERKMDLEFQQANQIMTKAAHYNPRNLKESYVVQDYIDSIFDSYE